MGWFVPSSSSGVLLRLTPTALQHRRHNDGRSRRDDDLVSRQRCVRVRSVASRAVDPSLGSKGLLAPWTPPSLADASFPQKRRLYPLQRSLLRPCSRFCARVELLVSSSRVGGDPRSQTLRPVPATHLVRLTGTPTLSLSPPKSPPPPLSSSTGATTSTVSPRDLRFATSAFASQRLVCEASASQHPVR